MAARLTYYAFRLYSEGTESGSTADAVEGGDVTYANNRVFHYRQGVYYHDPASIGATSFSTGWKLQYNKNGAGWNDVNGASSVVRSVASANIADGAATTRRLAIPSGGTSFDAGTFDEVDGAVASETLTDDPDLGTREYTELLWCCQIQSGSVSGGDTIQLRAVKTTGTSATEIYSDTVTITIASTTQSVTVTGITTGYAAGSPRIKLYATPNGIASAEAMGSPTVSLGAGPPQSVTVGGIASAEALGAVDVDSVATVTVSGVASGLAFGVFTVTQGGGSVVLPVVGRRHGRGAFW